MHKDRYLQGIKFYLELCIVLVICSIPILYDLGGKVIELWDESRNACSAIEMLQNHNYIVRFFQGSPDMWELKPPLLTWLQVFGFKMFGISEWTVRLPVAVSVIILVLLTLSFFRKEFNLITIGSFCCLIMVSSDGFIDRHVGRTGDHDAILILWLMLAFYYFFKFSQTKNGKYLILISVFLTLAVLTKSIIGLIFLPGFFIYAIYKRQLKDIFRSPYFYIGLILFLVVISGYYLLREKYSPGYLTKVWNEELFVRYLNKEGHYWQETFWYYLQNFVSQRFVPWIYMLPLSIPAYFLIKDKKIKDLFLLAFFCFVPVFLIISKGCKNLWYDGPLYPLMALLISLSVWGIYNYFLGMRLSAKSYTFLFIILVAATSLRPYLKIIHKVKNEAANYKAISAYSIPFYLREQLRKDILPKNLFIVYNDYSAHILFYTHLYEIKYNLKLEFKSSDKLEHGDVVIMSESNVINTVKEKYEFVEIEKYLSAVKIKIISLK